MSADSTPHKRPREEMFREALDYAQQTINGAEGRDPWLPYEETWFVIAEAYISLFEQLEGERTRARWLEAVVKEGEATEARLKEALRAYRAIFAAWEGRESITLNEEALRQWKSIADSALSNPASSPSKAAGGWCERHGGYLGQRCATCALEVANSAPASEPKT